MKHFNVDLQFWLRKTLRRKILTAAILPVIFVQIAVGFVTLASYSQVTTKLLIQRDKELARLMAHQLSALMIDASYGRVFVNNAFVVPSAGMSEPPGMQALSPDTLRLFLNSSGIVRTTMPERPDLIGQDWSDREYIETALESGEPFVSDIMTGPEMETEFVAHVTPIVEDDALLGLSVELAPWTSETQDRYAGYIAQLLQADSSAKVYLVDSEGRVIYHFDDDYIGEDFSSEIVVELVLSGEANAVRVENMFGQETISSFAAVPNTNWGLILEDDWRALTRDMRAFRPVLVLLLLAGVIAPTIMIAKSIKHVTSPIEELTAATQEVAAGDFNQTIEVTTGDEIEALATQFNRMSARLRESYTHLEQRVTERTAELETAKEAAEDARKSAEAANRAKSIFLANMSHELRTPLNAILGYSQLMARDPQVTSVQRDYLDTIGRSGEHLLALINDVLTMSKIEAGRAVLQENAFDLHRLLMGLQEMFAMRAANKQLSLILDIAPDVPQYIYADESKLRQILMNLLSNAVKFTEEGGVTLRVGSKEYEVSSKGDETTQSILLPTPYSLLLFEVEDTGPGIAQEEMRVLFDPFIQTASGHKSQEGTGLGLPISRQFVALMHGELTVSSVVGEGSIFRVQVPVQPAEADDVETRVEQAQRRVTGLAPDQHAPDGGPYRLLVVEDQQANREVLVKLLEPFGFEMRCAVNGQEGIEMWESWQPHLVWMDMRMPVLDGYAATRQIKARARALGRTAIIVALTASAFEEDRDAILAAGCDDFVRKPFRENEVFDILTRHLGVQFIYETPETGDTVAAQGGITATDEGTLLEALRAVMRTLPGAWQANLHRAAVTLDAERITAIIADIRPKSPRLADALAQWVHNFDYEKIIQLTEQQ